METLGQQCLKTGNFEKALFLFETKLQSSPNDPKLLELVELARKRLNPPQRRKSAVQKETMERVLGADPNDYYQLLGVSRDALGSEIAKKFREIALLLHPDKNVSEESTALFTRVKQAYEVLRNPTKRKIYDDIGLEAVVRVENQTMVMDTARGSIRKVSLSMPETFVNLSQSPSQRSPTAAGFRRDSLSSSSFSYVQFETPRSSAAQKLSRSVQLTPLPTQGFAGPRVMSNLYEPPRWMMKEFEKRQAVAELSQKDFVRQQSWQKQHQQQLEGSFDLLMNSLRTQKEKMMQRSVKLSSSPQKKP